MSWSTQQTHRIVEQFWENGEVRCPDDNSLLKLRLHKLHGGDYELHAECPVCGKRKEFRRGDDPKRHLFRLWTMDEIHGLDRSTNQHGASPCPVCHAPVQRHPMSDFSVIRCFRCGNSDQWQRVYLQD